MPARHPAAPPVRLVRCLAAGALCAFAALPALSALPAAGDGACRVRSGAAAAMLVELYTSEGCSSCPPADRWLSQLAKARPDVVPLAFHVHYWDDLGWRDRFASPAFTRRQAEQRAVNGVAVSYTPQVVVNGRDRPDWPRAALPPAAGTAAVSIILVRDGSAFRAVVEPKPGAPARLAGWWAVTEDGHASRVAAGENRGETLHHDAVVREQRPVASWNARPGEPLQLAFTPATQPSPGHPRRVVLVVTDAASGRPLQALQLGC